MCTGEDPGSRVLDILEPVRGSFGGPKQDTIIVIKVEGDEEMDEFFSNGVRK